MLRILLLFAIGVRLAVQLVRGDILGDIAGVFDTITSIPGAVVRAIYHAIAGVFGFFSRLGTVLDSAWDWMVNGIEWLGDRAVWVAGAAFNTISWLITRWVPMAAHWALGKAVAYAIGAAKAVEHFASSLVHDAIRFLSGVIHTVEQWARAAFRFLTGELGKVLKWIAAAGRYVFGILAHPQRLVAWIIPDLLVPLIKFAITSSAPIIRWLIGATAHLLPELATTLEDAISRIL